MYYCKICDKTYRRLGAHYRIHSIPFEAVSDIKTKKARLLLEHGNRCQICQNTEWMGKPIPLEIDHIDGNSDNSQKNNFRLLCPNCHAQTPTYCAKNVGQFPKTKRAAWLKRRNPYRLDR